MKHEGATPTPTDVPTDSRRLRTLFGDAQRLVGESSWLYLSLLIGRVLGVVNLFVFVRSLGLADFAVYSIVVAYVTLVNSILDFRAFEAVIQFVQRSLGEGDYRRARAFLRKCYQYDVGTGILATLVIGTTAPLAATFLLGGSGQATLIVIYGLATLAVTANTTNAAVYRVCGRFRALGCREIVGMVLRRTATIGAVLLTNSLFVVMVAEVAGSVLHAVSMHLGARRLARLELGTSRNLPALSRSDRRRLRHFMFGTNIFGTLKLIVAQVDILLVGVFVGTTSAGMYRIAKAGAELHQAIINPLHTVFHPRIVRAVQEGPGAVRYAARSATLAGAAVSVPLGLALLALAPLAMATLGGSEAFREAGDYLRIMLVGTLIGGTLFWAGSVLMANEAIWVVNLHTAARSILAIALLVITLPAWGLTAASLVYAAWLSTAVMTSFLIALRRGYLAKVPTSGTPRHTRRAAAPVL